MGRADGLQRQLDAAMERNLIEGHQHCDACLVGEGQCQGRGQAQIGRANRLRSGETGVHTDQPQLLCGLALLGVQLQLDSLWGPSKLFIAPQREICVVAGPQTGGPGFRWKVLVLSDSRGPSGPRPPAVKHDPKAHHKGKETDLVDAVHHAQIQSSFFVLFEQI